MRRFELAKFMPNFRHEMFPALFKNLFWKMVDVHCHNTSYATNYNYFMREVSTNAGQKNNFSTRCYSLCKSRTTRQK